MKYLHAPVGEADARSHMAGYYDTGGFVRHDLSGLNDYGRIAHVGGPLRAAMLFLGGLGIALSRGFRRAAAMLLLGVALALLLAPVLTVHYESRFAVPAAGPMAIAAGIGLAAAWERLRSSRGASADPLPAGRS